MANKAKSRRPGRVRLDTRCVELGLAPSRERAQALILAGEILLNGIPAQKAGTQVALDVAISHKGPGLRYVSRGGLKLEGALQHFAFEPADLVVLDVGASTGGFTDCLLQQGAKHVIAVDVGFGQLDWKLRNHDQVTVVERTNIRHTTAEQIKRHLPETMRWPVDLITIDVSFISLTLVIPAVVPMVRPGGVILALVKPQFEAGRNQVGKGGVVRDEAVRQQVIARIRTFAEEQSLCVEQEADAAIRGPKGNLEHWLLLRTPATTDRDEPIPPLPEPAQP